MIVKTAFTEDDHREFELALIEELKFITFTMTEADSFLRGWLIGKGYSHIVKNHLGFIKVIAKLNGQKQFINK